MGETALKMGINVIIDLDLTDLFFSLYRHDEYFQINQYDPKRYKEYDSKIRTTRRKKRIHRTRISKNIWKSHLWILY